MKKFLLILALVLIALAAAQQLNIPAVKNFFRPFNTSLTSTTAQSENVKVVNEESVVTNVVQNSLPSVVTIGVVTTTQPDPFGNDPFSPFSPFRQQQPQVSTTPQENNIGSGFIISADGLVITNRHVVEDTSVSYKVLTNDNKKYDVEKIYRDPLNDLAILKINATGLKPLKLGNSDNLKLGQTAIAIGTPLGEFKNTVTAGIISGVGRGITAGSPFQGSVEKLDNVIQTDAAISPGNSGGPLLNSAGQVIGINTAVASEGQNIGFAIPVNIIKELINKFNQNGGSFERPFVGVRYQMVTRRTAVMNNIVEGAYVVDVVQGSPADKSGIQPDDIITEFDGQKIDGTDALSLTKLIDKKKVGDTVRMKVWRNGDVQDISLTLEASK
jgi:S1-C subfamily serine protease